MYIEKECPRCHGQGLTSQINSVFFGMLRRSSTSPCALCCGQGRVLARAVCSYCGGRGLLGNESELCRLCNGTGTADEFSGLALSGLVPGTPFSRRCNECGADQFEIAGEIEAVRQQTSWDLEEELREYETSERIRVRCLQCANSYYVPVDRASHARMDATPRHGNRFVRLEGSLRCANIKCEYYCPDGYCLISDHSQK